VVKNSAPGPRGPVIASSAGDLRVPLQRGALRALSIKEFSTWWKMISFHNSTQISKALSAMTVDIWLRSTCGYEVPYDAINQLFIVGGCGWASTNSAAQTEACAVARRPAAGRCAVFVVPFSFGYFSFGQAKEK
jgi:hypothetical protein